MVTQLNPTTIIDGAVIRGAVSAILAAGVWSLDADQAANIPQISERERSMELLRLFVESESTQDAREVDLMSAGDLATAATYYRERVEGAEGLPDDERWDDARWRMAYTRVFGNVGVSSYWSDLYEDPWTPALLGFRSEAAYWSWLIAAPLDMIQILGSELNAYSYAAKADIVKSAVLGGARWRALGNSFAQRLMDHADTDPEARLGNWTYIHLCSDDALVVLLEDLDGPHKPTGWLEAGR